MLDIDWKGLALPFAYLIVLGGALMTFSTIYRRRKAAESANLAPWFGPHLQRDIYLSLLHLDPEEGAEKAPRVPDGVVRAALLRRAGIAATDHHPHCPSAGALRMPAWQS
ncbi:translocation sec66 [Trichoderma arundinaceum]|uniref:Translocation sec66 n=1 Tax=Trichoderma arundinaceum TaxID=490622 RepID=A0A395NLQ6_TRIAR|nr:translocation sec66 [Trichoderma arundinaceum]